MSSTCRIVYNGRELTVQKGTILRTALLRAGETPHNEASTIINCRGLGTCGTCAVRVQGAVEPESWTTQERLRLNFPPHTAPNNERLRLACQVTCQGPALEITKMSGFWGSGGAPAQAPTARSPRPPLGDLEFILDRRSPPSE